MIITDKQPYLSAKIKSHGCASSFKLNRSQLVLVYRTIPNVLFRTLTARRTSANLEIRKKTNLPCSSIKPDTNKLLHN